VLEQGIALANDLAEPDREVILGEAVSLEPRYRERQKALQHSTCCSLRQRKRADHLIRVCQPNGQGHCRRAHRPDKRGWMGVRHFAHANRSTVLSNVGSLDVERVLSVDSDRARNVTVGAIELDMRAAPGNRQRDVVASPHARQSP
jgi:hypothetical protein